MAINFYTSGPALVVWDGTDLGYTEDRVQIVIQPFYDDIHSDSWGGLAGPFADRQLLGAIAQVSCLLVKYDLDAVNKLSSFVDNTTGVATAGEIGATKLGEFMYQDLMYAQLDIKGTDTTTNSTPTVTFTHAHVSGAFEFNASMRHRRYQVNFMARMDSPCSSKLFTLTSNNSCFDD